MVDGVGAGGAFAVAEFSLATDGGATGLVAAWGWGAGVAPCAERSGAGLSETQLTADNKTIKTLIIFRDVEVSKITNL